MEIPVTKRFIPKGFELGTTSSKPNGFIVSRKRAKSTKTFVDNKREKLQKKLTQEGKQDILLQHSQKQLELQWLSHQHC